MSATKLGQTNEGARRDLILSKLVELFTRLFGKGGEALPLDVPLIELGVDSLFLLQASQVIRAEFGVKVPFRLLLEELSTIEALAAHLDSRLPADFGREAKPPATDTAALHAPAAAQQAPAQQPPAQPAVAQPAPARPAAHATQHAAPPVEAARTHEPAAPRAELQPAAYEPEPEPYAGTIYETDGASATAAHHIIAQQLRIGEEQLRLMSLQLELLRGVEYAPAPADAIHAAPLAAPQAAPAQPETAHAAGAPPQAPSPSPQPPALAGGPSSYSPAAPSVGGASPQTEQAENGARSRQIEPETFVPFKPLAKSAGDPLGERQRRHLDALIERVNARTRGSKRVTEYHRPHLANKRATAGYRQLWKELIYPLVVERGSGSRIWDVDGNEYVDLTTGFGALLFGHSPAFIVEALEAQLAKGLQIGAHTALTGEVAQLICELTGVERVAFCNSGTEAVMGALRLARAVTGRTKIALFEGCYHGTFDGIMVRGEQSPGGGLRALPMAPGVPQKMVDDVLLLKYNSPESVEIVREHAHELAAVLIEPPRSRRPDVQPQEFLRALRAITEKSGAALIFDEVVTGFRFHPGGAQAMFGIQADLVTYGKAVGGGLPVAVIAGKAAFMDAVDGGMWNYGDSSFPEADITFMTGTYFQHPVIMAALKAALNHIKEQGPQLQERLAAKTARIAETLNAYFERKGVPLKVAFMGSLFRLLHPPELKEMELFYYHLLEKGVFVCETRNCLLSTAHTDEDVDFVIDAFMRSTDEMVEGGFMPARPAGPDGGRAERSEVAAAATTLRAAPAPAASASVARAPLTEGQKQIWALAGMDDEGGRAYNQSFALHLRGPLDGAALVASLQKVVARHEALRATFSPDGDYQEIAPSAEVPARSEDLSGLPEGARESELARLLDAVAREPFDMARGPLLRAGLFRLSDDRHVFALTMHHIVSDGWSMGIILRELEEFYAAAREGREVRPSPPDSFVEYAREEAARARGPEAAEAERYWLERLAKPLPLLHLPTDGPRPESQTYEGAQQRAELGRPLYAALKSLSAAQGCTNFMTLLAVFKVLLHHLTGQEDLIVGTPAAGQLSAEAFNLVGYCVNLLPVRSRVADTMSFAEYLASLKRVLAGAYEHQSYPYALLLKRLNPPREPGRSPLVEAVFNVDRGSPRVRFFDIEAEIRPNHNNSSKFDLTMDVTEGDGVLTLDCEYNTRLFGASRARRWMEHYESLLGAAAAGPHASIGELREALRESERLRQEARGRQLRGAQLTRFRTAKRKAVRAS